MSNFNEYDAIVIGSGMGALTTAAILSKLNQKKVLILEQHYVVGGYTHEFERNHKFHWDVGLHYVGNLGKGELLRVIFDYITDGKLIWTKMPDPFQKFIYPDFTFAQSSDPEKFKADLIEMFPAEKKAIERYFSDMTLITNINPLVKLFHPRRKKISRLTTKEYLDQNFQDNRLKALLASQWGTYGVPPEKSSFATHAEVIYYFLKGGWYPVGGASQIAQQILPVIEKNGGQALVQHEVKEIIISDGVAKGVKVQKTHQSDAAISEYYAPIIISDAGAFNTYTKLIPPTVKNNLVDQYREEIKNLSKGYSTLTLFLGFKESPDKLGFQGEDHFIFTSYEHDKSFQGQSAAPDDTVNYCYISFASLKDPTQTAHVAQVLVFIDYDFFAKWQQKTWKHRSDEYYGLKTRITENILNFVDSRYPGFKDLIEYCELSTPLTFAYFDASNKGAIYGTPAIPERIGKKWVNPKTPIKNLYLTGVDLGSVGIMGATIGGVKTAGVLNGAFGFYKIMAECYKQSAQAKDSRQDLIGNAIQAGAR